MESMRAFFNPTGVVLIGATDKEQTVGHIVAENLLMAKESRKIYFINPNKENVLGMKCYPELGSMPEAVELAVIATNAKYVVEMVEDCGKMGVQSVIIISAGFKEAGEEGKKREAKILDICHKYNMRVIGPNCLGIIRPSNNLNTTFITKMTKPGRVAFLSQSGALGSAVLDWAISRDIGFSAFVSLGSMLDVDFGDLIDYLGEDPETKSIIIYLESLGNTMLNAKKFMSAVRGFARTKPILVIKPGKSQESKKAAQSHTGAMVGEDIYYDATFDRAGVVRVEEIQDLFNCASILNTAKLPKGPNLAIITNAGGPAALATDALISRNGKLTALSSETIANLNKFLPHFWSKSNPIDILGDADVGRYIKTIEVIGKDTGVNGILVIYTPQGVMKPRDLAKALVNYAQRSSKPILTTMMGSEEVYKARKLFYEKNIPTYEFPEEAIKTYMYMYNYARNLEELYETPEDLPLNLGAPKNHLKILARNAIHGGNPLLSEEDSKKILATYGIRVVAPHFAETAQSATGVASGIGYPVVMKISSPDISHKSDVGGVALNLASDREVEEAFNNMMANVKQQQPSAKIKGVNIQKMVTGYDYELIVGSKQDPVLGPVIMFGLGGVEAEFFKDIAVGLPPLNQKLARRILERTKTYTKLSKGFRAKPPVNLGILDETLVRVSNLIVDFPEIKEMDINPLVIKDDSVVALDARILLNTEMLPGKTEEFSHLIIHPYPTRYTQPWQCHDGRNVVLRPIRPEDETLERELIAGLSPQSSRYRFFQIIRETSHEMLSRYCNIDYAREMAIIAEYSEEGKKRNVGVGRLIVEDGQTGEFAVLVADDFQGKGLGFKLCDMLIGIGQDKGLKSIYGIVLNSNHKMINLTKRLGFTSQKLSEEESKVLLEL